MTLSPSLYKHGYATARVYVYAPSLRCVPARALVDQGSAATFVTENLVQLLRLPRRRVETRVSGVGNTTAVASHSVTINIGAASRDGP